MIFITVAVLAAFVAFIFFKDIGEGNLPSVIRALVTGLVVGVGISGFANLVVGAGGGEGTTPVKKNLAVLTDGKSGVEGSFFLGIGSVSSGHPKFSYYIENDKGAFELHTSDAERISVVEEKSLDKPYAIQSCHTGNMSRFWSWPYPAQHLVQCDADYDEIEFHVPAGSIKSNYTLDAQ